MVSSQKGDPSMLPGNLGRKFPDFGRSRTSTSLYLKIPGFSKLLHLGHPYQSQQCGTSVPGVGGNS